MARNRKDGPRLKLKQPDRSGPDPSYQTLLDLAEQRGLLKDLDDQNGTSTEIVGVDEDGEALVGRLGESVLWATSLTMIHFTLDVLVASQYAVDTDWGQLGLRTVQAFPIIFFFFYLFHPHPSPIPFLPKSFPPARLQPLLHQLLFFIGAVFAGIYLIHITNVHGYYAVMKMAPPVGALWIWSMVELDLAWALGSLACFGVAVWWGGYEMF